VDELLQPVPMAALTNKRAPFMVEIPVSMEAGPYLVSGTKTLLWIESVRAGSQPLRARVSGEARSGALRAAVRLGKPSVSFFEEVVSEVASEGRKRKWGNGFLATRTGIKKAVVYVRSYGIPDVEVLLSEKGSLDVPEGVTTTKVSWIPEGRAVVVPKDRSYLGLIGSMGESHWTAAVHNPSRGMAVLGRW